MRGRRDARRREPAALFRLRGGMVDLEDREPLDRLQPIGEGVEPGAENDDLAHAATIARRAASSAIRLRAAMNDRKPARGRDWLRPPRPRPRRPRPEWESRADR